MTPRGPTGAGTTARPVTRYLPAAVLLVIIASDALVTWTGVQKPPANPWLLAFVVSDSVVAPFVGLFIVRRHPGHPVGWLLVLHGLFVVTLLGSEPVTQFMTAHHIAPTSVAVWDQAGSGLWPLLYLCIALVAYIFPDGHFLSRRWRIFVAICLGGYLLFFVSAALNIKQFDGMRNPPLPTLPPPVVAPGVALGLLAIAASLIGAVVAAGARLRQAAGEERVRLLWVLLAAVTVPVGLAGAWLVQLVSGSGLLVDAGVCVTGVVVPIAIGVGILRHRLFDIELVVSRTLTYGALTALVIGIYAGVLAGLGAVLNHTVAGLVGVGIVAVAIQPVHSWLRRRAERWVYGDRSDPYAALRRLSQRVEAMVDPAQVVTVVTDAVAEALRVDRVVVELDRPDLAAQSPPGNEANGPIVRASLVHQAQHLGNLVVHVPPGRQLSAADRAMLDDLARHAAVALNAVHLTLDLQDSRARLVTAREEERRRLRHDLHDGLGPSLAAMVLKLGAVRASVDDGRSGELLDQLRGDTKAAVAEIRRLVDGLRPPTLDEVGLVAALAQHAEGLSRHRPGRPLVIEVAGPEGPISLPAAVEVAAYRIAMEALTNVVRHAHATYCAVTVAVNGTLELSVRDDGVGIGTGPHRGVGLWSMHARAAELGGTLTAARRPGGGTCVLAVLPLALTLPRLAPMVPPSGTAPGGAAQVVPS